MRALIITEEQYPHTLGGGTTYLRDFEKGLNYLKINYKIIAARYYKGADKIKNDNVINLGANLKKSKSFLLRSIFKLYYIPIWFLSVFFFLLKNRRYKEYDIINTQETLFSGPLSLVLAKLFKKKVCITMHGHAIGDMEDRMSHPILFKMLYAWERFIVSKFDIVFCISREITEYYSKINKNAVFVPNFIDTSLFEPRKVTKADTFAYIGRLSKEKDVETIIKAARYFPGKNFWIIGDGPERENLESLSKELKLKNVTFLGRRNDVPKLHQKIDIMIYIWKNEPFGLVALEAMASGIPVICADTNELHSFVGKSKSGIVIAGNKISELTLKDAIKKISKKENIIKFSENALKTSKDYDYKRGNRQYVDGYKKVLKQD